MDESDLDEVWVEAPSGEGSHPMDEMSCGLSGTTSLPGYPSRTVRAEIDNYLVTTETRLVTGRMSLGEARGRMNRLRPGREVKVLYSSGAAAAENPNACWWSNCTRQFDRDRSVKIIYIYIAKSFTLLKVYA